MGKNSDEITTVKYINWNSSLGIWWWGYILLWNDMSCDLFIGATKFGRHFVFPLSLFFFVHLFPAVKACGEYMYTYYLTNYIVFSFFSYTMSRYHHHHYVVPPARISLTLSRHFSLLFIASGRSSGLHPESSQSCCVYVQAGCLAFARPYAGVHRSTSLMSSSLLLQQCPACLVCLT